MSLKLVTRTFATIQSMFGYPRRYFDILPDDVVVDNIFFWLDVIDILRVRMVNLRLYTLTTQSIVWKRLLRRTELPLPPLPPTSRHSLQGLSFTEAERLLVRAYSLDKIWRKAPQATDEWSFEAWYHVAEMKLLPGSQYLVASVSDASRTQWALVLYVMDSRYGVIPIAKRELRTKAYNLQAKYMKVGGVMGITIAYLRMDWRFKGHSRRGINISDYDASYDLDLSDQAIDYECMTLHVSLQALEALANDNVVPGSKAFLARAREQRPPFCRIDFFMSETKLSCLCLDEFGGKPALMVVQDPNIVKFRPLDGPPEVELHIAAIPTYEEWDHHVKAIRPLPQQAQVLIIREIKVPRWRNKHPVTSIELVTIDKNTTDHPINVDVIPNDVTFFYEDQFAEIHVNEHGTPNWFDESIIPDLRQNWSEDNWKPRPISLYLRTIKPDDGMMRLTFYPRKMDFPIECPIASPEGGRQPRLNYHWRYTLDYSSPARWVECFMNYTYRILPGAHRTLLYTTSWDEISAAPELVDVYRYHDEDCFIEEPEPLEPGVIPPLRYPVKKLPLTMKGQRVSAAAWDETVGRFCFASPGTTRVNVMDLARRPKQDPLGRRYPVPVQTEHDANDPEERDPLLQPDRPPHVQPLVPGRPVRRRRVQQVVPPGYDSSDDEEDRLPRDDPMDVDLFPTDHYDEGRFEENIPVRGP